jgi:hypothetical protein
MKLPEDYFGSRLICLKDWHEELVHFVTNLGVSVVRGVSFYFRRMYHFALNVGLHIAD